MCPGMFPSTWRHQKTITNPFLLLLYNKLEIIDYVRIVNIIFTERDLLLPFSNMKL